MSQYDQLVPYYDSTNQRFLGPGDTPDASIESFQAVQAAAATATIPLGVAARPGTVTDVRVAAITPLTGNDTYTVDIKKNGVTILTAAMALLAATGARISVKGNLAANPSAVVAGDFFEAVVTATHNTGTEPANIVIQVAFLLN